MYLHEPFFNEQLIVPLPDSTDIFSHQYRDCSPAPIPFMTMIRRLIACRHSLLKQEALRLMRSEVMLFEKKHPDKLCCAIDLEQSGEKSE